MPRHGVGLGLGLSGCALGTPPLASVSFAASPFGAVSLPSWITFSRASTSLYQTGLSTTGASAVAVNTPVIADIGTGRGLVCQESRTNYLQTSNSFATWALSGLTSSDIARTANAGVAPDGSSTAAKIAWITNLANYGRGIVKNSASVPATSKVCSSVWLKTDPTGLYPVGGVMPSIAATLYPIPPPLGGLPFNYRQDTMRTDVGQIWRKYDHWRTSGASGSAAGIILGSQPNEMPVVYAWHGETCNGLFPGIECGVVAAATPVTRSPDLASAAVSTVVASGCLNFDLTFIGMGGSTEYNDVAGARRILTWNTDGYVEWDPTTKLLTFASGGQTVTLTGKMTWQRGATVKLKMQFGGGLPTTATYRSNGGPVASLGAGAALPNVAPSGSTIDLFRNGSTQYLSALFVALDAYDARGVTPTWLTDKTVSSTFVASKEQRPLVSIYGNSRIAGNATQYASNVGADYTAIAHPNFEVTFLGHVAYTTPQLIALAPTEVDPLLDSYRFASIHVFWELINDADTPTNTATCLAHLSTYHLARRAAGWGKQIAMTANLADPARQPTIALNSPTVDAANNALRAGAWTAYADALYDPAADPYFDMTSTAVSGDGTHFTDAAYRYMATRLKPIIESLWSPASIVVP